MLYIALLHYPVLNKDGKVVTTSIANMDIHDIARLSKTYGVCKYFVVNPLSAQRDLACEIINHWRQGYGSVFNPSRRAAFELVSIKANLDEVASEILEQTGCFPQIIVTGANFKDKLLTCSDLKKKIGNDNLPYLLIFGTGSGIACEIVDRADYRLEPVKGSGEYNHLAVRSAVAIILDRIMRD
ncbi:MAG: RNA methyltransferase [Smithellaceae bacterium]